MPAEALLPDTEAIPEATVEFGRYRKNQDKPWMVRYRTLSGYTQRQHFKTADETNEFFWYCVAHLRHEVKYEGGPHEINRRRERNAAWNAWTHR